MNELTSGENSISGILWSSNALLTASLCLPSLVLQCNLYLCICVLLYACYCLLLVIGSRIYIKRICNLTVDYTWPYFRWSQSRRTRIPTSNIESTTLGGDGKVFQIYSETFLTNQPAFLQAATHSLERCFYGSLGPTGCATNFA